MSKLAEKPVHLDYQFYYTRNNNRVLLMVGAATIAFLLLLGRLFYLQVLQGNYYAQKAVENQVRTLPVTAPRGLIYDRKSRILATNKLSHALMFDPRKASPTEARESFQKLSELLGIPVEELTKSGRNAAPDQPYYLRHQLGTSTLARIMENQSKLPGIEITTAMERFYPENELASHLIGYLGQIHPEELKQPAYLKYPHDSLMGKAGLEKSFESTLRGQDGKDLMTFNPGDGSRSINQRVLPIPGHSLKLTLDKDLQTFCQKLLRRKQNQGAALVMDVHTGGLLAMVSEPSYNLNLFSQGLSQAEWNNLLNAPHILLLIAVSAYAPGSIFKIVTAAAASEGHYLNANRTFYSRGYLNVGGHIFYDWNRGGFGIVNIHQALAYSIDTVFYEVSLQMGIEAIKDYAARFGLTHKTGIELPHENEGIIPDKEWKKRYWKQEWHPGDTVNSSIGQGYIQLTPLQAVQMIATVANGGKILRPRLVDQILDNRGRAVQTIPPEEVGELSLSAPTWEILRTGLRGAVTYGTAKALHLENYPAAGKTGTAETHRRKTHAWVVAYAPVQNPRYAICIFLEYGGSGGGKAAPIAHDILEYLLQHDKG